MRKTLRGERPQLLIIVLLIGIVTYQLGLSFFQNDRTHREICVQIDLLKGSVRQSLKRGEKSIPTIAYYKHHPAEARRAVKEVKRQLALFRKGNC